MSKYCFGIDVGGTTIKCGLFQTDGLVVDKWEIVTRSQNSGENILPDIAATIEAKLKERDIPKSEVAGIGVGIPGPVVNGKCSVAVNLHWGETDIQGILENLTGMPVRAGNDANVAALGEMWKGGGEGHKSVVVVTLGTGVGGGIIIDGKMVEGSHGAGGEIGHAHVTDEITDPCNCGNCGCLEQVASATGVVRLAREELAKLPAGETSRLQDVPNLSCRLVFDEAKNGDAAALRIVERFGKYLGTALSVFATVVDPEVFVIGGGVSKAGDILIDVVSKYYKSEAFPACQNIPIVLAKLGNDAGIYGSARLVLD